MSASVEALNATLQLLGKKHPEQEEIIRRFAPLLRVHAGLAHAEAGTTDCQSFTLATLPTSTALAAEWAPLFLAAMQEGFPNLGEQPHKLEQALVNSPELLEELLALCRSESLEAGADIAQKLGLQSVVVDLLRVQLQQAFARRAAACHKPNANAPDQAKVMHENVQPPQAEIRAEAGEAITQNLCPLCHSSPCISVVHEVEGKRSLVCSLCGHMWDYKRTACVSCKTDAPKNMQHYSVEDMPGEWAESCEACKHYVLGVDIRKINIPLNQAFVWPLGMNHWDYLMQEQGYKPLLEA